MFGNLIKLGLFAIIIAAVTLFTRDQLQPPGEDAAPPAASMKPEKGVRPAPPGPPAAEPAPGPTPVPVTVQAEAAAEPNPVTGMAEAPAPAPIAPTPPLPAAAVTESSSTTLSPGKAADSVITSKEETIVSTAAGEVAPDAPAAGDLQTESTPPVEEAIAQTATAKDVNMAVSGSSGMAGTEETAETAVAPPVSVADMTSAKAAAEIENVFESFPLEAASPEPANPQVEGVNPPTQ